ncbi:MAG: MFS transporter [Pirellulales bacterium]
MDDARKPRLLTRPDVFAWAMYDWANSAYSTLSITIVVVFFSKILYPESIDVAGPNGTTITQVVWGGWSGAAYAYALAAATLIAGVLSPIVGALADARGNKHVWLARPALAGAACCLGMAFVPADPPWAGTALFFGAVLLRVVLRLRQRVFARHRDRSADEQGLGVRLRVGLSRRRVGADRRVAVDRLR